MLNANWRKLAQDVKLHKTVSQWQGIAGASRAGSKGSGIEASAEVIGGGGRVSRPKRKANARGTAEKAGRRSRIRQKGTKQRQRGEQEEAEKLVEEERVEIVRHVTSCILPGRWNSRHTYTLSCTVARTPCPLCS